MEQDMNPMEFSEIPAIIFGLVMIAAVIAFAVFIIWAVLKIVKNTKPHGNMNTQMLEWASHNRAVTIAKNLLKRNRPIDEIVEDTGLTHEEVENLR